MNAVIDIGSNSVRMMIYASDGLNKKLVSSTALASGLAKTGKISSDAIIRTALAISEFVKQAKNNSVNNIYIFGTEAMRSAANSAELIDLVKLQTGIDIDVVSGEIEAKLGFLGVRKSYNSEITVIDVGGASIEVVQGDTDITFAKSMPLGCIKLLDTFGRDREKLHQFLHDNIAYPVPHITKTFAIGGTPTTIASMLLHQKIYDNTQIHNYDISLDNLSELEEIIFTTDNLLDIYPTLSTKRAKIIGQGCIALYEIMQHIHVNQITVSECDNMEGYLMYNKII